MAGFGTLLMALILNEPLGRGMFVLCGTMVLISGILLIQASRKPASTKAGQ